MLEVTPIIQLWALESKTAINIMDPKLKTALAKLKVEQQQCKIERQEAEEESGDYDNTRVFVFVVERKNMKVTLGIEEHKKGAVVEENKI